MSFEHITVVHVNGSGEHHIYGQRSIRETMYQLPGSKGLLLSPDRPTLLLDGVRHVEIPRLSRQDYSFFVVYGLHQYIDTEFALIVQEDGWALNGSAWRDEFLNYDYIGAPIHLGRVSKNVYHGFTWTEFMDDESVMIENVFNGGFSLRSKRFLEAPSRHGIPYTIAAPIGPGGGNNILNWHDESNKEDVQVCLYMRGELERLGVRFCTLDVAKYFSFEHLTPKLHDGMSLKGVFGHHAHRRKFGRERELIYSITTEDTRWIYGEDRVIDLFRDLGYTISFKE